MMDQRNVYGSMLCSFVLVALLLQVIYTPAIGAWLPRIIELCACYWIIVSPATFGIVFAFLVGVLVSLIEGSFIGSASIGLSLVAYVLLGNIHTIRQLDAISQSLLIFLLIGIYLACHRLTLSLVGVSSDGLSYLLSATVSALIWRPFSQGLDRIRFELGRFF